MLFSSRVQCISVSLRELDQIRYIIQVYRMRYDHFYPVFSFLIKTSRINRSQSIILTTPLTLLIYSSRAAIIIIFTFIHIDNFQLKIKGLLHTASIIYIHLFINIRIFLSRNSFCSRIYVVLCTQSAELISVLWHITVAVARTRSVLQTTIIIIIICVCVCIHKLYIRTIP